MFDALDIKNIKYKVGRIKYTILVDTTTYREEQSTSWEKFYAAQLQNFLHKVKMSQIASCHRRAPNHRNAAFGILVFCCPYNDEDGGFDQYERWSKSQKRPISYTGITVTMKQKAMLRKIMMMMSVGCGGELLRVLWDDEGSQGGSATPRSATRSQSPQKLILHHFCRPQNLIF